MFWLLLAKPSPGFKSFPLFNILPSQTVKAEERAVGGEGWIKVDGGKKKVPVPCDHRVGGSGGDAGEGDGLLVVGSGVEGLLEHRQHRRDCGEKSTAG